MKTLTRKPIYLLLTVLFFSVLMTAPPVLAGSAGSGSSGTSTGGSAAGPKAVYPQLQYEFAPVMEGDDIKHDFIIENHGDAPLVIQNVRPD